MPRSSLPTLLDGLGPALWLCEATEALVEYASKHADGGDPEVRDAQNALAALRLDVIERVTATTTDDQIWAAVGYMGGDRQDATAKDMFARRAALRSEADEHAREVAMEQRAEDRRERND